MKKALLLATAMFGMLTFTSPAMAVDGWSKGTLKNIRVSTGRVIIIQNTPSNPGNCDSTTYFILEDTHNLFDQAYATLLTALSMDVKVELGVTGCSTDPTSYPMIDQVWIRPDQS